MRTLGKITFETSWDDGAALDLRLADLMAKYDVPAVFYIPVMWESYGTHKGWLTLNRTQLLDLSERFEIGSHGITHALMTRVSYETAKQEITESKTMLEDLLGKSVTKYAYPRGYANDPLRDIVRNVYSHGRSTLVTSLDLQEDPAWQHTTLHVAAARKEYANSDWYEFGKRLLRQTQHRKHSYYRLFGHSHEIDRNNAWNALELLIREIKDYADISS